MARRGGGDANTHCLPNVQLSCFETRNSFEHDCVQVWPVSKGGLMGAGLVDSPLADAVCPSFVVAAWESL